MEELVSIIIPVYNVGDYLDECVQSIVSQTYNKIEILLINDGSIDNSPELCKKWKFRDSRVRYFSKNNEGLGPTRNFGVMQAKGKYVMFVDSDDWVSKDYVKEMYNAISNVDADMAECDFFRVPLDGGIESISVCNHCMKKEFSKCERILLGNVMPWKKILRREFLLKNNIKQPAILAEGFAIYPLEIVLAKKIACVNIPLYYYRQGRRGTLSYYEKIKYMQGCSRLQYVIDEFKRRNLFDLYEDMIYQYLMRWASRFLVRCLPEVTFNGYKKNEYDALIESYEIFFASNFINYNDSKNILLGGYNLTKILQKNVVLENPYLRFNFSSIISIMSSKNGVNAAPMHRNVYRKHMLEREFYEIFWNVINEEKPNNIIIDFIEERHDILEFGGTYYTLSDALKESDFPIEKGRVIRRDSEECKELWEKSCLAFIDRLKKHFIADHVILIENTLAERHGDVYNSAPFDDLHYIQKTNSILKGYYDFFRNHFEGIQFINMANDVLYITDDQYEYGCHPWHLNELINRKIGESIQFD